MTRKVSVSQIGSRGIPGRRGGVERVIEAIAPRLVNHGYDVTVYCDGWSDYKEKTWKGVKLDRVASLKHKYLDTIVRSALASLKEIFGGSQIVHIHGSGSAPLALVARLVGKKTVVTVHGMDWQRRKWNWIGKMALQFGEWSAIKFPHRTVVVGPDLKTWLDAKYKSDVLYIPNGVEIRPRREPNKILEMGLQGRNYVLFLARLVPEKQVHLLIEAWKMLADKHGMTLAIAGPTWHSVEYAAHLKELAGDDASIQFLGEVDEVTLEELYGNCYSYVLPSEVEGMSLSLLDALAFGACAICSDIPPNVQVLGDAGVAFKSLDATDLRDKLAMLMADPEWAERLRVAALARATADFGWDEVVKQWDKLYVEVMGKTKPASEMARA